MIEFLKSPSITLLFHVLNTIQLEETSALSDTQEKTMRIYANTSYLFHDTQMRSISRGDAVAVPGSPAERAAGGSNQVTPRIDFTNTTRKNLFDWMNEKLRTGKMNFEESTAFLNMTIKIRASDNYPVPIESDNERINFLENARAGLDRALLSKDTHTAKALRKAMDIMLGASK